MSDYGSAGALSPKGLHTTETGFTVVTTIPV